MTQKNCEAAVPHPGAFSDDDTAMLDAAHCLIETVRPHMERQALHEALEAMWTVVRAANSYIDRQAPWTLRKTDPERMATVLYVMAEVLRHLAITVQPFVPDAGGRLLDQLAVPSEARDFDHLGPRHALTPGTALPKPQGLFPRIDEAAGEAQTAAS